MSNETKPKIGRRLAVKNFSSTQSMNLRVDAAHAFPDPETCYRAWSAGDAQRFGLSRYQFEALKRARKSVITVLQRETRAKGWVAVLAIDNRSI